MSSALHTYLHDRFEACFGKPTNTLAKNFHWALPPPPASSVLGLHVLVDAAPENPSIWIFDPFDTKGVSKTLTANEIEVDGVITLIQARLGTVDSGVRSPAPLASVQAETAATDPTELAQSTRSARVEAHRLRVEAAEVRAHSDELRRLIRDGKQP